MHIAYTCLQYFASIPVVDSVPASTVSENPRFISGYICKSSIFSFIEKTLGYSLAVFQVPHAIPL
jgi:hypothetical protein